jgi:hypothetical protein
MDPKIHHSLVTLNKIGSLGIVSPSKHNGTVDISTNDDNYDDNSFNLYHSTTKNEKPKRSVKN